MTMRRALIDRLGPFDEDYGPGAGIPSGADTDYIYRAYIGGAMLEYVPDMTVSHYHGRKTKADGQRLLRRYMIGTGALYARYLFKHPNLCRSFYWDCKNSLREIATGSNTFLPDIGFSHRDKVIYTLLGAVQGTVQYVFTRHIGHLYRKRYANDSSLNAAAPEQQRA